METILSLLDATILLDTFQAWLDVHQKTLFIITWTCFLLGVITTLGAIAIGHKNRMSTFIRLFVLMGLFSLSPQLADFGTAIWKNYYYYALQSLEPSMNTASAEFDQLSIDSGLLLGAMGGGSYGAARFASGMAGKVGQKFLANFARVLSRWLNATIIPAFICAFTIYLIFTLSGISMILGAGFLPMAVAICMLSPRAGEQWLSVSFNLIAGSILTVMLAPGLFAAVMDQLVIAPVQNVNAVFADTSELQDTASAIKAPAEMERIQNLIALKENERAQLARQLSFSGSYSIDEGKLAQVKSLDREIAGLRARAGVVVETWVTKSTRAVQKAATKLSDALKAWIARMVVLVLWGIAAVWFLHAGVGVITSVIGGVAIASAEAISSPFAGAAGAIETPQPIPGRDSPRKLDQKGRSELTSGSDGASGSSSRGNKPVIPPSIDASRSGERSTINRKFGQ